MKLAADILEQELIKGCQKKQPKAQEMLYKHFFGYAMSICLRYSYSREEAGEILNDAFMKVFEKIHTYKNESTFKAWLRRIIINTAIDCQRKNLKNYQLIYLEDAPSISDEPDSILEQLSVEDILKLLDQLPNMHRLVFNLYEVEGYSHSEIAQLLQIAEGSSRTLLLRAKKQLRNLFDVLFNMKNYEGRL